MMAQIKVHPGGPLNGGKHPQSEHSALAGPPWFVNVALLLLLVAGAVIAGIAVGTATTQASPFCLGGRLAGPGGPHFNPEQAPQLQGRGENGGVAPAAGGQLSHEDGVPHHHPGEGGPHHDRDDHFGERGPPLPVVLRAPSGPPVTPPARVKCSNETLLFELSDGSKVAPDKLIAHIQAMENDKVVQLTARGLCGGFTDSNMQLLVRAGSSSDVHVVKQIFLEDEFHWLDRMYPDRRQVRRIMDLGSNVGMSLLMFSHMYPHAQLIGVEPEIHNFGMLSLNTGHRPQIFLERGSAGGRLRFDRLQSIVPGSWGFGAKPSDGNFDETKVFPTYTVPYLLDKHGWPDVDLLKVDIEGSELELVEEVLAGAQWMDRVRCVCFEVHDWMFEEKLGKRHIQTACDRAMEKTGMSYVGQFGELLAFCRAEPALTASFESWRAADEKAYQQAQQEKLAADEREQQQVPGPGGATVASQGGLPLELIVTGQVRLS